MFTLIFSENSSAKGIRTVSTTENEIASVRVVLGYSTLLQFDSRPTQAVVGDQDSFKIEYVGNSIAIKPLISGVSTNLFVVTQYDKFNFRITAGRGVEPDFVLKVRRTKDDAPEMGSGLTKKAFNIRAQRNGIEMRLISVASTKSNSALLYAFEISGKNRHLTFQPGDFEVLQGGRSLSIENIYLESLKIERSKRLQGVILVRREDVKRTTKTSLMFSPGNPASKIEISVPPL